MWLRDSLPFDLEKRGYKVRILTFGYDSALTNSTATPSIQHYARMLFDGLNSARQCENVCVHGRFCTKFDRLT